MSALETVVWRYKIKSPGLGEYDGWVTATDRDYIEGFCTRMGYLIEPLTPLAPAQAEIERLNAALERYRVGLRDARKRTIKERRRSEQFEERALAAEEQVRVLSEALERISKVRGAHGVEHVPGTERPQMDRLADPAAIARKALAALQHKDNHDGR